VNRYYTVVIRIYFDGIITGLKFKKNFRFMLFTIKTLHNFCVYYYLELKRYPIVLHLSIFRIKTLYKFYVYRFLE